MVENFGFTGLGARDKASIQNVEDIIANTFELLFNLLAIVTDGSDVLIGALGFLLLLNRRDDAPGSTARANHVLVGNGKKVTLIDGKFTTNLVTLLELDCFSRTLDVVEWRILYLGNFLEKFY